jgi:hypothetical protein
MELAKITPAQYLNSLEGEVKNEMKKLHSIIRKAAPNLKPFITRSGQSTFLGYGKYEYKTKSGCGGDWFILGATPRAHGLSIYAGAIYADKKLHNKYTKLISKGNFGKSCIRVKKLSDIDEKVLIQLVKDSEKAGPAFVA